jgi:hypothetical protein
LSPCLDNQAAQVRVLNTVPGLTVDYYINDVPRITNLKYMELTRYISSRPGPRNLKIYEANTKNLLLEIKDIDIILGQLITDPIYGSKDNLKFVQLIDDINESIMPDETKVRIYNLTSSGVQFTLSSPTTSPMTLALSSGNGTKYTKITPSRHSLKINFASQNSKTININLKPGRIYTVYIIDNISSDSPNYTQLNIPQVILVVDGNTLFAKCTFP